MPAHTWPGKLPFTCASRVHRQGFVLSHVCCVCFSGRDGDDGGKKHMERLLNIWQERSLYRPDFIQQLKLAIEDSDSPKHKPTGQSNTSTLQTAQHTLCTAKHLTGSVCHATHNTLKYVHCAHYIMQMSPFTQICLLVFKHKKVITLTKHRKIQYPKCSQCI